MAGDFKAILDEKVDKATGYSLVDDDEITKLVTVQENATANRADSENADKVHPHTWGQVTGQPATATRWPAWEEVSGKPGTFNPSAHTHPVDQVTGLGTAATRNVGTDAGNVMEVGAFGLGHASMSTTYPSVPDTGTQVVHYVNVGVPGPLGGGFSDRTSYLEMSCSKHRTTIASDGNSLYFSWVHNKAPVASDFRKLLTATDLPTTATRWPTAAEITGLTDAIANIPSVPKSADYTVTAADKGKSIDTSENVAIPPSVFTVGDEIVVTNTSASSISITPAAGVTLRLAGSASTGLRTLAGYGVATFRMVSSNVWFASGAGLS